MNEFLKAYLQPYALAAYLAAFIVISGGILYYGHTQYSTGLSVARAEAVLQVAAEREAERTRQVSANEVAQQEAQADITKLLLANNALQAQLKDNAHEASLDPTASRECLSAGGVRRLNAIR